MYVVDKTTEKSIDGPKVSYEGYHVVILVNGLTHVTIQQQN